MAEAKGPTDFTGYWVCSSIQHLDEFLKALGFPWIVRKAAVKFGSSSVDVISHTGATVRIASLNPKGSWTRAYDTERTVTQPNAEGVSCKTTAWWEGQVLRTRLEGSPFGVCDSWRYRRGDTLVVKTTVKRPTTPEGSPMTEASCFWFFERMQSLQKHVGGSSRATLLRALAVDQKRIEQATRKDNTYLQKVLLDWNRWASPADEFIKVAMAPSAYGMKRGPSVSRLRSRTSPASSPLTLSQSPSASSLHALAGSQDGGSSAVGPAVPRGRQPGPVLTQEISLAPQRGVNAVPAVAAPAKPPPGPPAAHSDVTFPSLPQSPGDVAPLPSKSASTTAAAVPTSPVGSDSGPKHARKLSGDGGSASVAAAAASAAAVSGKRVLHYRSPSVESSMQGRGSPGSSSRRQPPTGAEATMVFKLHQFLDGGILSVVPVATPNDTAEPQLLGMSPEQAEETAAKLRELETDMLLRRQEDVRGFTCCGFLLSREKDTLPDHLRVWEMTLA